MEPPNEARAPAGAVLTGGASRRMGRPKAWLDVAGVPMAVRVATVLAEAGCDPVVFVGAPPPSTTPVAFGTVPDRYPGEGPLGGVISALHSADTDVVVAACDLAMVTPAAVGAVLAADPTETADVVVATAGGHHVPLARWRRRSLESLASTFATGARSWRSALDLLATIEVAVDEGAAIDVDTHEQLRAANAVDADGCARPRPGR